MSTGTQIIIDKSLINKLNSKSTGITNLTRQMSEKWLFFAMNHFEAESGAFTMGAPALTKWQDLSPRYKKQRYAKGYTGPILTKTGIMISSIHPFYDNRVAGVGTNIPYAKTHEQPNNPAGFLEMKSASRSELFTRQRYKAGKKKGKFKKGTTFGKGFTRKESIIRIPKRPFIALSSTESNALFQLVKNYLTK
ncbi:phage virion morphogenesis protein [Bacteroidota bacterium]